MSVAELTIGAPFFDILLLQGELDYVVTGKAILLNLADHPISIESQTLGPLQSVILRDVRAHDLERAVLITGFADYPNEVALLAEIRASWPTAFALRGEERLRGVEHYMSPKIWMGQFGFTLYHSASVPLNVGLHRDHAFCPVPGFREVHTQIIGIGKMQQCRARDPETLYWEEPMAPGTTHRPMYDAEGNYPWHQYETTTPSVFMAVEMLPDGAQPPEI